MRHSQTGRDAICKTSSGADSAIGREYKALSRMQKDGKSVPGIVNSISYSETVLERKIFIPDHGPTLSDLLTTHGVFSLKTTLMIADQILVACQKMHARGVYHGHIGADTVVVGSGAEENCLLITDFYEAAIFPSKSSAAIYCHMQRSLGWKDIQDIYHLMCSCLRGKHQIFTRYFEDKSKGPSELEFFRVRFASLASTRWPDYSYLRKLIDDCLERSALSKDFQFEWIGTRSTAQLGK